MYDNLKLSYEIDMDFNKELYVDRRKISNSAGTFIIAETGVNHNGDMKLPKD